MQALFRFLNATDARLMLVVCVAVLLATMGPHGVLTANEEQYLAEAWRSVNPQAWPQASNLLGGFPHAIVFNTLMGHAVDLFGFPIAQAIGRTFAIALYAVAFVRLFQLLGLAAGDLLFVLIAFIVAGEGLVGNEWMFRGIEPKVPAYGMVLLSMTELLRERPGRCYAWLVPATYMHAFVGGFWAVIFTIALLARRETRLRAVMAGALASLAMLPFLFYLVDNGYAQIRSGSTPVDGPTVGWILSYVAFPWHTSPFIDGRSVVRWMPGILGTALIAVASMMVRNRASDRIERTLSALAFIASIWVLLALLMTAYFDDGRLGPYVLFRPSGMGLLITLMCLSLLLRRLDPVPVRWLRLGLLAALLPSVLPILLQIYIYPPGRDLLRVQGQRALVEWVRTKTPAQSVFIVDPGLEESFFDFERRTGRASFFVHRFAPGLEADIRQWYRRQQYQEGLFAKGCTAGPPPSRIDYAIVENRHAFLLAPDCAKVIFEGDGMAILQLGVKGE